MRRLVVLLSLALAAPAAGASALPRLHAERGAQPRIAAAGDRTVLLRGVNVNQLGDYYRQSPALDPVVPLRRADFAGIASLGMNVVRLLVHWSALEPRPGVFDEAYLARIRQAVGWARERRIYVVLDMHQDAWGKFIATPDGETCAPGSAPQQGWDGAPQWATLTAGAPTCRIGLRELSPAVGLAFQAFWNDQDGIQTALVKTWAKLAGAFAGDPAVAGYDLLNEPNPGLALGITDVGPLAQFYARAIPAIRAAERAAPGGFSHIAFFEPSVIWSAAGTDAPPTPALLTDPDLVFAPHLYGGSIAAASVADGYRYAEQAAAQYGATVWSGEWGWFGDPKANEAAIREYVGLEDEHLWGGAWWDWKQACGDPHMFGDGADTEPEPVSVSLNRFACPAQTPLGIPPTTRRLLARPYVRSAPGRITQMTSDPAKRVLTVTGSDTNPKGSCALEAWVPGKARPRTTATHARRVRSVRVRGGWRLSACVRGDYALTIR
ncbi:MAG: glycoside hydrolase family 5 protein [Solirubrobacteraceae bacterium]